MAFKTFTASAILTAADVNTYLMKQAVIVCTSATRPAAVDGMTIYETDTDRLLVSPDGATWVRVGWNSTTGRTGCRIRRVAVQAITTATATNVSFDTEDADSDAYFAPTSTTVTIPANLGGVYAITFDMAWSGDPVNGFLNIVAGGKTFAHPVITGGLLGNNSVAAVTALAAADTIVCTVRQQSGASLNVTGRLEVYRLGT